LENLPEIFREITKRLIDLSRQRQCLEEFRKHPAKALGATFSGFFLSLSDAAGFFVSNTGNNRFSVFDLLGILKNIMSCMK
jgi:hypothetical protein